MMYVTSQMLGFVTDEKQANEVLAACEGLPALFSFNVGSSKPAHAIPLQGNALDVTFIQTSQTSKSIIVSIDNVHKPGSTTEVRDNNVRVPTHDATTWTDTSQDTPRLQYFSRTTGEQWQEDASLQEKFSAFVNGGSKLSSQKVEDGAGPGSTGDKALRDILYNVENLRKRPGTED